MITFHSLQEAYFPQKGTSVALGLFDGLHPGHQLVIRSAVQTAQRQALTPCVFTFSIGHSSPAAKPTAGRLCTASIREQLLSGLGVSHILCPSFDEFREQTPEAFVRDVLHGVLHAGYVFCGENYRFGKDADGSVADLYRLGARFGIEVFTLPLLDLEGAPVSTTRIRNCIVSGDMPQAMRLLGRPFAIDFEVIHGRRLGRTINSPTINQAVPDWFVSPRYGVYATVATVQGRRCPAVTNVGRKPTVGSDRLLAETCILGYDGDLYGQQIPVEFYQFIRPEQKFASVEELRAQIRRDAATAKEIANRLQLC